jgi:hypothetical protein
MDRSGGIDTLSGWLAAAPCLVEQHKQTNKQTGESESQISWGAKPRALEQKMRTREHYLLGTAGRVCGVRRLGLRIQRQLLQQIRGFFARQIDELRA